MRVTRVLAMRLFFPRGVVSEKRTRESFAIMYVCTRTRGGEKIRVTPVWRRGVLPAATAKRLTRKAEQQAKRLKILHEKLHMKLQLQHTAATNSHRSGTQRILSRVPATSAASGASGSTASRSGCRPHTKPAARARGVQRNMPSRLVCCLLLLSPTPLSASAARSTAGRSSANGFITKKAFCTTNMTLPMTFPPT